MAVVAYHCIVTAYGFWLPNDPRGSWSDFVRQWELLLHGRATKVDTRRSVAAAPHDKHARLAAKQALAYPPVEFSGKQALAIGIGFKRAVEESGYKVYACSILPHHAHLVLARHRYKAEMMIGHLKGRATQELAAQGMHPLAAHADPDGNAPSPWARNGWVVYLNDDADVLLAVRYVVQNPVKEGRRRQGWSFVVPYAPCVR